MKSIGREVNFNGASEHGGYSTHAQRTLQPPAQNRAHPAVVPGGHGPLPG